jgi:DNA-binding protein HU-beta
MANTAMKKSQLGAVMGEKMGVSKKQGMEFVDMFIDVITAEMRKGNKVNITGFGIFKVSDRKAREGRNPRTGETIHIKASKKPRFTPGKLLKEAIAG